MSTSRRTSYSALYFFTSTVLLQIVGVGAGLALRSALAATDFASMNSAPDSPIWPAYLTLLFHSLVAAGAARLLRLPGSWQLCNLLLAPAAVFCIQFDIAPELALIPMVLLLLVYVPTFWTRVPFYPTSRRTYDAILAEIPGTPGLRFIDLGSGFGTLLYYLKHKRPDLIVEGSEISPLPALFSRLRGILRSGRPLIYFRSFWKISLEPYDIVYAFLAPGPMAALWEKAKREMRPGTLLIVNSFPLPTEHFKEVVIEDHRTFTLFMYRI